MKKLLFLILLPVLIFAQDRTFSDKTYTAVDSVVGTTISNTAYAFAADRLHFASYYIASSSYTVSKIRFFSQRGAGSPAMKYTATLYSNNDGSTLPSTALGSSADSIAYIGQTGQYYNFDFRFDPAISITAGDTIWYGGSTIAFSSTNYWNIGRYTDAGLAGLTLKSANQSSWASYLTDPLGMIVYTTPTATTETETQDKSFKEYNKKNRLNSLLK